MNIHSSEIQRIALQEVTVSIELITPKMAIEYLESNTKNRTLRILQVNKVCSDIINGRWGVNGSTIVFSKTGVLMDGQHRLAAIVKADTPAHAIVCRGVSDELMSTIDNTIPRKAADFAQLNGLLYARRITAAAGILLSATQERADSRARYSTSEIMEFLARHTHLQDSARETDPTIKFIPASVGTAWFYMARFMSGRELHAIKALEVLISGVPSYAGDPMHVFRERLIRTPYEMKNTVAHRMGIFYTLVCAWNDFICGKKLSVCKFRKTPTKMIGVDYENI